jgi:thiamine-monophosphate kinase
MGEFELLARVWDRLPDPGPRVMLGAGDDAAVTIPGGATATSVDAMIDGVHFRRAQAEPRLIGRKALAAALSDLAAMAAEPGEAYVVLGAPPDLEEQECLELVDGMVSLAVETGTAIVGGDVTRAPVLMLSVTVVGHAPSPEQLVQRGGARPGDLLVLTGELGGAAAGLALLERPQLAAAVAAETAAHLRHRQLDPAPRLKAGRALAAAGATAMIDLSDGLGGDAGHVAERSGAALRIEAGSLPLAKGVAEIAAASGRNPLQLAVSGGEDYELLAALPPERLADASSAIGEAAEASLTPVGEVVEGAGVEIRLLGGASLEPRGYDQLRR